MATLDEVFNRISERLENGKKKASQWSIPYIYKYVVIDESGAVVRNFLMDLRNTMSLTQSDGEADCTFTVPENFMIEVGSGRAKMEDGIFHGIVKFEGNQEAFVKLQETASKNVK